MAYAIIKTGGRQYRVAEGDTIDVDLLEGEAGQKMTFDDVLMHADGEKITHGSPSISGAATRRGNRSASPEASADHWRGEEPLECRRTTVSRALLVSSFVGGLP